MNHVKDFQNKVVEYLQSYEPYHCGGSAFELSGKGINAEPAYDASQPAGKRYLIAYTLSQAAEHIRTWTPPKIWHDIKLAPKNGKHIRVGNFSEEGVGFGYFDGKKVYFQTVAHYWSHLGEEGFYPSVGCAQNEEPLQGLTHFAYLEDEPEDLED